MYSLDDGVVVFVDIKFTAIVFELAVNLYSYLGIHTQYPVTFPSLSFVTAFAHLLVPEPAVDVFPVCAV